MVNSHNEDLVKTMMQRWKSFHSTSQFENHMCVIAANYHKKCTLRALFSKWTIASNHKRVIKYLQIMRNRWNFKRLFTLWKKRSQQISQKRITSVQWKPRRLFRFWRKRSLINRLLRTQNIGFQDKRYYRRLSEAFDVWKLEARQRQALRPLKELSQRQSDHRKLTGAFLAWKNWRIRREAIRQYFMTMENARRERVLASQFKRWRLSSIIKRQLVHVNQRLLTGVVQKWKSHYLDIKHNEQFATTFHKAVTLHNLKRHWSRYQRVFELKKKFEIYATVNREIDMMRSSLRMWKKALDRRRTLELITTEDTRDQLLRSHYKLWRDRFLVIIDARQEIALASMTTAWNSVVLPRAFIGASRALFGHTLTNLTSHV